jgi:ATP-dependent Clp protease ATP-binding subunit ClpA
MISQELQICLDRAFKQAQQHRHELVSVQHLLLALLDNDSATGALKAFNVDIEHLRNYLRKFTKENTPISLGTDEIKPEPTLGYSRVMQRSIQDVSPAGFENEKIDGVHVLASIFHEHESHAVAYLKNVGINQIDIIKFIKLGVGIKQTTVNFEITLDEELAHCLGKAYEEASKKRYEFITVENIMLALLDNKSAIEVLNGCSANIEILRMSLSNFIKDNSEQVAENEEIDIQPTSDVLSLFERAIVQVQASEVRKNEINGANMLVAIFGEIDSQSVYYLQQQGINRLNVVNFIETGFATKKMRGQFKNPLSIESQQIMDAIKSTNSRFEAAAKLGISPRTLRYKLAQMRSRSMTDIKTA